MKQNIIKIKGLINIANKAGYLIIGADALKGYNKKLYLMIYSSDIGKNTEKIVNKTQLHTNCVSCKIDTESFKEMVSVPNCKVLGIKNKGISKEIIKYLRGDYID